MKSNEIKTEKDIDEYLAKRELKKLANKAKEEKGAYVKKIITLMIFTCLLLLAGLHEPFRVGMANFVNELVYEDSHNFIVLAVAVAFYLGRVIFDRYITK